MRRLIAGLARLPTPWTTFLALVLAALVGVLDYATGYDFHVTAFYLVPICWASWAAGRTAGLFLATVCTVIFEVANLLSGSAYAHPMIAGWNALMLLALFVVTVYSITAASVAYRSMHEGESRFRALFAQSLLGAAQVETATGRFVRVNQRFCAMFGYTAEELLRMDYQSITHPEDLANSLENVRRLAKGEAKQVSIEKRYLRKDGGVVWGSLTMLPLWNEGEKPDFNLSLVVDITASRQFEERLRQSQKMESIGHLAGGMAHEFNNILAAMTLDLNLIQMFSKGAEARDLLNEMEALCRRAADLIKQLLAFSHQSVLHLHPVDLAVAVARQCKMLDRLLGERFTLEVSSPDGLPWVNADQGMIEQVLLNLCLNARDAMEDGGFLRLNLAETEVGAEQAKTHERVQSGRYVCLSVADTGCGMDERTMKRLFEPFFTTKHVGQGTGLGLATVRGIVEQHHGWVEVESHLGKGSTFRVYLPAIDPQVTAPPVRQEEAPARGSGTILMVEDEPAVRTATRMFLARMGYAVIEAGDGQEALTLWEEHRAKIDLIYTDMVMPGNLTGLQLAERILAEKPGMKVIITSGYNTDLVDLKKISGSSIVYLPKPCPPEPLTSVIQACMQRA